MALVKEIHMLGGVVRIFDDEYAGISEEEMERRRKEQGMAVYRMLEQQILEKMRKEQAQGTPTAEFQAGQEAEAGATGRAVPGPTATAGYNRTISHGVLSRADPRR